MSEIVGHKPVLLERVIEALAPIDGGVYIDGTYGGGGYSRAVLVVADCKVIGVDRDPDAIERAWAHSSKDKRLLPAPGRFGELDLAARAVGHELVDGVMLDLGVSSYQLDEADRGFSFMRDGPLDMRMEKSGPSAADAVNLLSEKQIAGILHYLGEESQSRRIARHIVRRRDEEKFVRTLDLADVIEGALGGRKGKRAHPATKSFQAIRLFINNELGELVEALAAAERVLKPGGRLVVVTFHSLEDRIVKLFLRERSGQSAGGSRHAPEAPKGAPASFVLVARRPIEPDEAELDENVRSRSARLRWAIRTDAEPWGDLTVKDNGLPSLDDLRRLMA